MGQNHAGCALGLDPLRAFNPESRDKSQANRHGLFQAPVWQAKTMLFQSQRMHRPRSIQERHSARIFPRLTS